VSTALLWLPAVVLVHVTFTTAISLALAMSNLFYRDVKYLFEVAITVWMFATSVVYPVSLVGGRVGTLLRLNPMTAIVDAYRDVLLHHRAPDAAAFGAVALLSVGLLLLAWLRFHRAEFSFAENV
jgi:ABC-type polysaccharide/polyol phosphate export permease